MINQHQMGIPGIIARFHQITAVVIFTGLAGAIIVLCDQFGPQTHVPLRPEAAVFRHVPGLGFLNPEIKRQQVDPLLGGQTRLHIAHYRHPTVEAEIIALALQQHRLEFFRKDRMQDGQILEKELLLQIFGVGTDDHPSIGPVVFHCPLDGRQEVSHRLPGAGTGFHQQELRFIKGLGNGPGHFHLRFAYFEGGELPGQCTAFIEEIADLRRIQRQYIIAGEVRALRFADDIVMVGLDAEFCAVDPPGQAIFSRGEELDQIFEKGFDRLVGRFEDLENFLHIGKLGLHCALDNLQEEFPGSLGIRQGAVGVFQPELKIIDQRPQTEGRQKGQVDPRQQHCIKLRIGKIRELFITGIPVAEIAVHPAGMVFQKRQIKVRIMGHQGEILQKRADLRQHFAEGRSTGHVGIADAGQAGYRRRNAFRRPDQQADLIHRLPMMKMHRGKFDDLFLSVHQAGGLDIQGDKVRQAQFIKNFRLQAVCNSHAGFLIGSTLQRIIRQSHWGCNRIFAARGLPAA